MSQYDDIVKHLFSHELHELKMLISVLETEGPAGLKSRVRRDRYLANWPTHFWDAIGWHFAEYYSKRDNYSRRARRAHNYGVFLKCYIWADFSITWEPALYWRR
jgi:hypothetical protein